ncbi:MAG: hypothetical protein AAGF23_16580 [Acidobacteriota bacterium]
MSVSISQSSHTGDSRDAEIAILYEHPTWFKPLFAELDRRGLSYDAIRADRLVADPAAPWPGRHRVVLNRMSPSAWSRGGAGAVFFTRRVLEHLEAAGAEVWNGTAAWDLDLSKSSQQRLVEGLGLRMPKTRVVLSADQLPGASDDLVFPLLVKPNIGGNGLGVTRVDSRTELEQRVADGSLETGPDGVYLLQEYHPPKGGAVTRVETLAGRVLYAIRVHLGDTTSFNLCPANMGCTLDRRPAGAAGPGHATESGTRIEAVDLPREIVDEVERIARAGQLDVGGVEFLESERDGHRYYYDVNAMSNFIADPVTVLGFDPTAELVDALEGRFWADHKAA